VTCKDISKILTYMGMITIDLKEVVDTILKKENVASPNEENG